MLGQGSGASRSRSPPGVGGAVEQHRGVSWNQAMVSDAAGGWDGPWAEASILRSVEMMVTKVDTLVASFDTDCPDCRPQGTWDLG